MAPTFLFLINYVLKAPFLLLKVGKCPIMLAVKFNLQLTLGSIFSLVLKMFFLCLNSKNVEVGSKILLLYGLKQVFSNIAAIHCSKIFFWDSILWQKKPSSSKTILFFCGNFTLTNLFVISFNNTCTFFNMKVKTPMKLLL